MKHSESSRVPLGLIALMLIIVGGAVALVAGRSQSSAAANTQPAPEPRTARAPPKPEPRALQTAAPNQPLVQVAAKEAAPSPSYQAELERATLAVEEGRYTEAANRLSVLAAQHLTEEGQKELQHCLQRTRVFSEPGFTKRCAMMVQERLQETTP